MKKILFTLSTICLYTAIWAQDASSPSGSPAIDSRKVRVGVFVRATPSWYNTNKSNYYTSGGAVFGYGFGLNLEFKINEVLAFKTGIGGDFDGGKINYTYNPSGSVTTVYMLDNTPKLIETKKKNETSITNATSINAITARHIQTSYVTIPVVLKMMTKEISGFKYYVDFGANIGVLVGAKTTDNVQQLLYSSASPTPVPEKNSGLNVYNECIPIRLGLNLGLGAEYRFSGSTSLFFGASFINSFIPVLKSTSVNNFTGIDGSGNFISATQSAKPMGIQVNVGVMF